MRRLKQKGNEMSEDKIRYGYEDEEELEEELEEEELVCTRCNGIGSRWGYRLCSSCGGSGLEVINTKEKA